MSVYYQDDTITLLHGDALEQASTLADGSVDCIVTSPPYYGLRDYGSEGQYGLEETPAAYVETMRALFSEARRVLADDGTFWLNIGDSYNNTSSGQNGTCSTGVSGGRHDRIGGRRTRMPSVMPAKNLLGMPWRLAFALQEDGWILRNSIIWHKPNAMPESVTDRLSGKHENLFMFSKAQRYWFDLDPIREEHGTPEGMGWAFGGRGKKSQSDQSSAPGRGNSTFSKVGVQAMGGNARGKNPGDVWAINTQPFAGAHFAVMPPELARRTVVSGCKPGGTVFDPFSGSGTTGLVAQKNGRKYVGIDISADYLDLSMQTRLQNGVLDFGGAV